MKQLSLFPDLDLSSDEPLQVNPTTNEIFNKFVEKKKESPVRKPKAVPPKHQRYKNIKMVELQHPNQNQKLELNIWTKDCSE